MPSHTLNRLLEWFFGPSVNANVGVAASASDPLPVTRHIPVTTSRSPHPDRKSPEALPPVTIDSLPLDVFETPDEPAVPDAEPAAVPTAPRECQWCDAVVPPEADLCPACGSSVQGDPAQSIPGLTELTEAQEGELDRPLRLPRGATADAFVKVLVAELVIDDTEE